MEAEKIIIGHAYECNSPLLGTTFAGTVEKLYHSSAVVAVQTCATSDSLRVHDLNGRLIVPFNLIKQAI